MIIKKSELQKGQSLAEAVSALGLLMIVVAAIATASITAVSNATFQKNQDLSNKYAQEGIEYVRNLKEVDFPLFASYMAGSYCLQYAGSNISIVPSSHPDDCFSSQTNFWHMLTFIQGSPNCDIDPADPVWGGTEVEVTVGWTSSKCPAANHICHHSRLSTCFFDNSTDIGGSMDP